MGGGNSFPAPASQDTKTPRNLQIVITSFLKRETVKIVTISSVAFGRLWLE